MPKTSYPRRRLALAQLGALACAASGLSGLSGLAQAGADCPNDSDRRKPVVRLDTNMGSITIELDAAKAPKTVENFLSYVEAGHYNNTVFHRVIDGFMIQGGGFEPGMKQKSTNDPIKNEADNGLKNDKYTIAMARTGDPHSASAQFFINVADNEFLNFKAPSGNGWGYCVFGKVVQGQDVVDKIKDVATGNKAGHQDVPVEDVVIKNAEKC
jgi:peptidyl-prolyl cis-trans isomerase B (cyclophilin B)